MYTKSEYEKYLELLNSFNEDISKEEFTKFFSRGVILHCLTYAEMARLFSTNRYTADKFIQGKLHPTESFRQIILNSFKELTQEKLKEFN